MTVTPTCFQVDTRRGHDFLSAGPPSQVQCSPSEIVSEEATTVLPSKAICGTHRETPEKLRQGQDAFLCIWYDTCGCLNLLRVFHCGERCCDRGTPAKVE